MTKGMTWGCLSALALAACSGGAVGGSGPGTSQNVIGGSASNDAAVMAFLSLDLDGELSLCSSVLIASDAVLTAAHCVDPYYAGIGPKFYVNALAQVGFDPNDRGWADVAAVSESPDFDPRNPAAGHDVAVARLKERITGTLPATIDPYALPAAWATAGNLTANPVDARIIGYGADNDAEPDDVGKRLEATVPIRGLDAQTVLVGDGTAGQACHADSGGPALVTYAGHDYVVSVASFMRGPTCTTGNYGTRLDANWSFLAATLGGELAAQQPTPSDFLGTPAGSEADSVDGGTDGAPAPNP